MEQSAFDRNPEEYDRFRPGVPPCLVDAVVNLSGVPRPVVADLGSGTGLSTIPWLQKCSRVIGVEPNIGMLQRAANNCIGIGSDAQIEFVQGTSDDTGLETCSIDVVAAASAAHWFPLVESKREILRILRPGGVFAHFYYYAVPLTHSWDLDQLCRQLLDEYLNQSRQRGFAVAATKPEVQRAFLGGGFDRDRLFYMHTDHEWSAIEYMHYIMTWGRLAELIAAHVDPLRKLVQEVSVVASRDLGDSPSRCTFSYPVNVLRKAL